MTQLLASQVDGEQGRALNQGQQVQEVAPAQAVLTFLAEPQPPGFVPENAFDLAHRAALELWGEKPSVIDPMSGGGSIPFEASRLGFTTYANEYNPVACSILEATLDYPIRFGDAPSALCAKWGKVLEERISERLAHFFPKKRNGLVHAYRPKSGAFSYDDPDRHLKECQTPSGEAVFLHIPTLFVDLLAAVDSYKANLRPRQMVEVPAQDSLQAFRGALKEMGHGVI